MQRKVPAEKASATAVQPEAATGLTCCSPIANRATPNGIIRANPALTRWARRFETPEVNIKLTMVRASAGL